jgi:hypothetical protein
LAFPVQEEGVAQVTALGRDIAELKMLLVDRILASTKEELLRALQGAETTGNNSADREPLLEAATGPAFPVLELQQQRTEEPRELRAKETGRLGAKDEAAAETSPPRSRVEEAGAQEQDLQEQRVKGGSGSMEAGDLVSWTTDELLSETANFLVRADSTVQEDSTILLSLQEALRYAADSSGESSRGGSGFSSDDLFGSAADEKDEAPEGPSEADVAGELWCGQSFGVVIL